MINFINQADPVKPSIRKFYNYKYGWFIHMPYYLEYTSPAPGYGDSIPVTGWDDVRTVYNVDTAAINWATLAGQAKAANADYVTLHIKDARGFRWWDSTPLDSYLSHAYNGYTVPLYGNFKITNSYLGLDNTFFQNAIDAFKAVNIDVCLYYNIGRDFHIRTDLDAEESTVGGASLYAYYDDWRTLVFDEIEEILNIYGDSIDLMWLDSANVRHPWLNSLGADTRYQNYTDLYEVFNRDVGIISNINLEVDPSGSENTDSFSYNGKLKYFPTDVVAMEWYHYDGLTDKGELSPNITHNGVGYYVPKEYAYSAVYRIDELLNKKIQYPWLDNATGYWNNQSINEIETQEEVQYHYDLARSYSLPFNCNVPLVHNTNDIDSVYLDRLLNINL